MTVNRGNDTATPPELEPVVDPGAWKAADFHNLSDITFELEERHLRALDRGLRAARASGSNIESLQREHFPLDDIADDLESILKAALDTFDSLSERADLQLALNLEPGDAYIANNYTVLHSRTAFEDHDAPDRHRNLLRLWLKACEGRPVVDAVCRFYRDDGISKREGAGTVYVHAGLDQ